MTAQTMRSALRLARNSAWLVSAAGVGRLAGFLASLLVARSLGPNAFGVYAVAQSFMGYAATSGDFGFLLIGTRIAARHPGQAGYLRQAVERKRWRIFTLSAISLALIAIPIARTVGEFTAFVVGIIAAFPTVMACDWLFLGLERFRLVALWRAAASLLLLAAVVAAMLLVGTGVVTFLVAQALALLLSVLWIRSRKLTSEPADGAALAQIDSESRYANVLMLGIGMLLLLLLNSFELFVVKAILGTGAAGYYSASMRLIEALFESFAVAMTTMIPVSARAIGDYQSLQRIRRYIPIALLIGVAGGGLVAANAQSIVAIVYGANFEASVPVLRWMSLLLPIDFAGTLLGQTTVVTGSPKFALRLSLLPLAFSIPAQPFLVMHFGLEGAVWGRIIAHGIQLAMISIAYWHRPVYRLLGGRLP